MHGGVLHYFDLSVRPLRDATGAIVGITNAGIEITGRKRAEANLSFLSTLTAALTPQTSAAGVADVVTSSVVRHFGLSRCMLVSIDPTGHTATVFHEHAPGGPSLLGAYAILEFHTEDERRQLAMGHAVVINDVQTAPRPAEASAQFERLGIGAIVSVPYLSDGQWRFVLSVVCDQPHAWQPGDAELLQDIASRAYLRLERATGRGTTAGGARHLSPSRRSIAVRHLRGGRRFPAGAGQHRRAESVRTSPPAPRPRFRGSAAAALAGTLCRPGDRHFPAHARDRRAVSRAEHGGETPGHRRGRELRLEDRAPDVARRPLGRGVPLLRPVGAAALRGGTAGRRSPEGFVPGDAGSRAPQSIGADSHGRRRAAHRVGGEGGRDGLRGNDRTAIGANGPAARRSARRLSTVARAAVVAARADLAGRRAGRRGGDQPAVDRRAPATVVTRRRRRKPGGGWRRRPAGAGLREPAAQCREVRHPGRADRDPGAS